MSAVEPRMPVVLVAAEPTAARVVAEAAARALTLGEDAERRTRWYGPGWLSFQARAPVPGGMLDHIAGLPGVRRVDAVAPDEPLYARTATRVASPVPLGRGCAVGDGGVAVIAGPCSVEGEAAAAPLEVVAEAVRAAGAHALRGGAFKPRTSPYAYGGLGLDGLRRLAAAGERVGLPVVSEALGAEDVDPVAAHAQVVQIGARNMHAFRLLVAVGGHPSGRPVLLKRGFAATLDELLLAAEYVLLGRFFAGHSPGGVMLCERGIRTFDRSARYTLDVAAIPALKARTHLPVVVDPSHAAGQRAFVPALALAAVAAGADGLLIETHPEPDRAWSDGEQTLDLEAFARLMEDVRRLAALRRPGP